jgi:TRAP-type C4-dicarboxylate transport system substrate-binding protein
MKRIAILSLMLVVLFSFSFVSAGQAKEKVYKWKFCVGLAYSKGYDFLETYINMLEEEVDGRIQFQAFQPGEHPYSVADVMKAVRNNVMQIGFSLNIYTQSLFPQMGLQDLPFLFGSVEEFRSMMRDPDYKDVYNYILGDPLKKWNQTPVAWFTTPGYMFAAPKFVEDFNSFDGLRIRIYSDPMTHMIKLFGGSPVFITWDEVYEALNRGMADGFVTSTYPAYAANLYEVCKYVTITDFSMGMHFLSVSNKALEELPKDLREDFLAACKKLNSFLNEAASEKFQEAVVLAMKKNGAHFKWMSPDLREATREKMAPAYEKWVKKTGGEADEILDRINKFHKEYLGK